MRIEEHIPLAPLTTFHIGGSAQYFARARSIEELRAAVAFAKEKKLNRLILGGGSNMLISDRGFAGLVINIALAGIEWEHKGDATLMTASAGEGWDACVSAAVEKDLWGIENLSGIPGSVGGAVVQNIGAYGAALSQTLAWVEVYDTESGTIKKFAAPDCLFGYRESVFKHKPSYIVLRAAFDLRAASKPELSYKDLAKRFQYETPALGTIREAVLAIRADKFPDLSLEGTAGSFFKNPILSSVEAQTLKKKYPAMPLFDMPETAGTKVPLAWLLDETLSMKGARVGGARLYEKQPLVIAAQKNTSSRDVLALAALVQKAIKEKIGIDIEPEVKIIS